MLPFFQLILDHTLTLLSTKCKRLITVIHVATYVQTSPLEERLPEYKDIILPCGRSRTEQQKTVGVRQDRRDDQSHEKKTTYARTSIKSCITSFNICPNINMSCRLCNCCLSKRAAVEAIEVCAVEYFPTFLRSVSIFKHNDSVVLFTCQSCNRFEYSGCMDARPYKSEKVSS